MERAPLRLVLGHGDERARAKVARTLALRPELDLVGEAADAVAATQMAVELHPYVALLDVGLPDLGDACRWITKHGHRVRIATLAADGSARSMVLPFAGLDLVIKPYSIEEFQRVLPACQDSRRALDPIVSRHVLARIKRYQQAGSATYGVFNERELEVLTLRSEGYLVSDLAAWFFISQNTVTRHFQRILDKLASCETTS